MAGRVQLMSLAYSRVRFGIFAMPIVSAIFAVYYRQSSDDLRVVAWSGGYFLAALVSIVLYRKFLRDQQTLSAAAIFKKWLPRVQKTALLHGLGLAVVMPLVSSTGTLEFKYLYLATVAAIMAGNATHQATMPSVFHRFLMTGWNVTVLTLPWTFNEHWQFVLPLCLIYSVGMQRYAIQSHHFYVQMVWLEEEGKRLSESYKAAKEEAESALREKNLFLATASHDLRQPIHAMSMLVEATALRNKDKAIAPLLTDLKTSMSSINQMFNSLLDLSKLEAGMVQPRATIVSLPLIVREVAGLFREQAAVQGLQLRLCLPKQGATVWVDADLLRRALVNLAHNALRYTQKGGILMAVRKRGKDWQIDVWDTGIGIAEDEGQRVFIPFFRSQHAWNLDSAGHGLGLAVVARCTKLMAGAHGVQSRMGQGSRFWLRLAAADEQQLSPISPVDGFGLTTNALPAIARLSGRCLVLDDDFQVITAWQALLHGWGIEGRFAKNSAEAFAHIDGGFMPAAIFCDQRLRSGESGFDILQALMARCPNASGAMVSGEFNSEELVEAENQGYLVLRKPLDMDKLYALLAIWLEEPTHFPGCVAS